MAAVSYEETISFEKETSSVSFAIDESPASIRRFLDQNGYVVIRGVLSAFECRQTALALEDEIRKKSDDFRMFDPKTHGSASKSLNGYGVIGKRPTFHPILVQNRFKENIVKAASIVYDLKPSDLLASHDRSGLYRATASHPEYSTSYHAPGLHLDHGPTAFLHDHKAVDAELGKLSYDSTADLVKENNLRHCGMCERGPFQSILSLFDNRCGDLGGGTGAAGDTPGDTSGVPVKAPSLPETGAAAGGGGGGGGGGGRATAEKLGAGVSGKGTRSPPASTCTAESKEEAREGKEDGASSDPPLLPGQDDGGHINVPGFHLKYEEWYKERFEAAGESSEMYRYIFDPRRKADRRFAPFGRRVTCPAGSMIFWDVRMAHGGVPNRGSSRARAVQFISYFPRSILPEAALARRKKLLKRSVPKEAIPRGKVEKAVLGVA